MKRLRHVLEYVLVWPLFALVAMLPIGVLSRVVQVLGVLWYALDGRRRRIAVDNVLRSRVTLDETHARRIARRSFAHFGLVVVESLKSGQYLREDDWPKRVRVELHPETRTLIEQSGQPVILAAGHFGNWEVAAQVLSWTKPVTGITRPLNNPYVNRLMLRHKPRHRFRLTPKHEAGATRFVETLRRGEILAFMIDQHAGDRGMMVPFFGHPASTHTAIALLHLVTGAPICYGSCRRVGPMRFEMCAGEPLRLERSGDKQTDIRTILESLNGALERDIRRWPEQFLWAHRRWRDPETSPEQAPPAP